jgi:glycosyltransferase involved in cell wall biosynthesis
MRALAGDSISIALATCNGARFIEEQLASLLAQTRLPAEIVVSDDASDDDCVAIVERVAASSPVPIRVFRNDTRCGYADNFFRSASQTKGAWIAFCDQDDIWLPHKLERCAEFFDEPDLLAVIHNANLMLGSEKTDIPADPGITATRVVPPLSLHPFRTYLGFSIVFRRELIDAIDFEHRPINQNNTRWKLPHDDWIAFLALALGRVAIVDEPLVWYRRHPNVVTRPKDSLLKRAHLAMTRYASGLSKMAKAAEERADYLDNLELDFIDPALLESAVSRYRTVAARTRQRQAIASIPGLVDRVRTLSRLAVTAGYVGKEEFVKDLLFGTLHLDRAYCAIREVAK